jgi:hypothetical protein
MAVPGGEDEQKSAAVCGEATASTREMGNARVKVLGMRLSARRRAVTVTVGVKMPRGTDRGGAGDVVGLQ